jgi:hypothetical protein
VCVLVPEGMLGRGGAGGAGRGGGGAAGAGLGAGGAAGFGAGAGAGVGLGAGAAALGAAAAALGFAFLAFLAGAAFLPALFFAAERFALRATAFFAVFAFFAFLAFFAFVFDFAFLAMIVLPIVAAQIRYGARALRRQGATCPIRTLTRPFGRSQRVALMRCPATPRASARRSSNRSARPYGPPEWPSPPRSA